jgi:hypothetical protein
MAARIRRIEWLVSVADTTGPKGWRRASAGSLVRDVGFSPQQASRWAKARREMSPTGLKRKLKERVN